MGEFVIFGLGRFGGSLASELQSLGHEVVGVDSSATVVRDYADLVGQAIEADATSEIVLKDLGVANFDAAVVAVGEEQHSIMTTLLLKKLRVRYVIAKANSALHGEILELLGADRVVYPERETATRLAHGIATPEVLDYLSLSREAGIARLEIPLHLVGVTAAEANIETRFKIRVLAVIRGERLLFGTAVGERFERGDFLVVSGRDDDLRRLTQSNQH